MVHITTRSVAIDILARRGCVLVGSTVEARATFTRACVYKPAAQYRPDSAIYIFGCARASRNVIALGAERIAKSAFTVAESALTLVLAVNLITCLVGSH